MMFGTVGLLCRCPFPGDRQRTAVLPAASSREMKYPSLHKRFVLKLFSFIEQPSSEGVVRIHNNEGGVYFSAETL